MKHLGLPSRLWLLFICTLLASPLAVATLHFPPPAAFGQILYNLFYTFHVLILTIPILGCLIAYYFLAETWFAVLFTVIVEIVPPEVNPWNYSHSLLISKTVNTILLT